MNEISKQLLMFIPYMKLYFMFGPTLSPIDALTSLFKRARQPLNHIWSRLSLALLTKFEHDGPATSCDIPKGTHDGTREQNGLEAS